MHSLLGVEPAFHCPSHVVLQGGGVLGVQDIKATRDAGDTYMASKEETAAGTSGEKDGAVSGLSRATVNVGM